MEQEKIKIRILPNKFLRLNGTFNKKRALRLSGKIAGECYDEEGFDHINHERKKKTIARINKTFDREHFSVYDHIYVSFELKKIPKILAMVLNNEHQYTTAEKSARYTKVKREEKSIITEDEERLYNKWLDIFKIKIKSQYGKVYSDGKIRTLAQENARYLVSVFMPTQMVYSTTLRQINCIASWMQDYIEKADMKDYFEKQLSLYMQKLLTSLDDANFLEERLMKNEKNRKLSLFGENLDKKEIHFGDVYSTTYKGSFAQLAQAHRHRTLDYQMEILEQKEYFIPPIIADDQMLVDEWLGDMQVVKNLYPQGELVKINEIGKYEDFILKCKERLCSAAQLEINNQTRETLLAYKEALEKSNHPLAEDIEKYSHGARCTFPDYTCPKDCGFKEGKTLTRKI